MIFFFKTFFLVKTSTSNSSLRSMLIIVLPRKPLPPKIKIFLFFFAFKILTFNYLPLCANNSYKLIYSLKLLKLLKQFIYMSYYLYKDDIPSEVEFKDIVAIDTETMGLNLHRDRLCLIQLSNGDGNAHLVQISTEALANQNSFINLRKIFKNTNLTKLFHFARFDIAVIEKNICSIDGPIYCTKIASKLSRTFGAKHGLADLCRDLLGIELDKFNQTSDWGTENLNDSQLSYAASDVLYLHMLKKELDIILKREKREKLALECFNFLKIRCKLDIVGFDNLDIFSH